MSRRPSLLLLSLCLTLPGLGFAGDLTPDQLARVRRDEKEALDRVNAAHGNRKPSEMSNTERRQVIQEQQKAAQEALEKNGVSAKDYARQTAKMGPKGNAEVEAASKRLEEQDKQRAAEAAKTKKEPGEIQVQAGFSEDNPVTLEEQEGAEPTVEVGLPPEEEEQQGLPEFLRK